MLLTHRASRFEQQKKKKKHIFKQNKKSRYLNKKNLTNDLNVPKYFTFSEEQI